MGFSWKWAAKSSILTGFSIINHPAIRVPHLRKPPSQSSPLPILYIQPTCGCWSLIFFRGTVRLRRGRWDLPPTNIQIKLMLIQKRTKTTSAQLPKLKLFVFCRVLQISSLSAPARHETSPQEETQQMGLSENRVYSQWNSHLKTGEWSAKPLGTMGYTTFSDTPKWGLDVSQCLPGIFHRYVCLRNGGEFRDWWAEGTTPGMVEKRMHRTSSLFLDAVLGFPMKISPSSAKIQDFGVL